jgi:hypothetical protein
VASGDASRASAGLTVAWARHGDADCLRITGWTADALASLRHADDVQLARRLPVYPTAAYGDGGTGRSTVATAQLPPMAGRYAVDDDSVCFVPRFPFREATSYAVGVADGEPLTLFRPAVDRTATTSVVAVYPSTTVIPRNHLRVYVQFSAPMSEGEAARRIHVRRRDTGAVIADSFLSLDPELWDPERRRLTVLFDPARIKRGLAPHDEAGYPLEEGTDVELVVDAGYRDASGAPLVGEYVQQWHVGPDVRGRVEPAAWALRAPAAASIDALVVDFDRPLDRALLERCLRVTDDRGHTVTGWSTVGADEQSWSLRPDSPWRDARHELVVDAVLEDLAGNSVARVFDREISRPEHDPRAADRVVRSFTPQG